MSKKTKARRVSRSSASASSLRSSPNWPLLAVSGVGIALTAYLSWAAFSGGGVRGCSAGGGCDVVLNSQWATLFGLPTAFWGLLAYISLAAIAFIRKAETHWLYAWTVALVGVCFSLYLTVVSLTILQSACPYCLTSLTLMSAALALVVWQRPPELAHRSWVGLAAGRAALAAVVIFVVHSSYAAPQAEPIGPEDPKIRALAEHLSEQGVIFYGASWCPHCQEQKRLFGASVVRLPYIECSPAGPNAPQAPSCTSAGIQSYPTWVIGGQTIAGEVLTLAQLAVASGFPDASSFQ
ncbi:MAG: vitamin K epoxide reductase family protein [Acidobacteria bacterium]|nr:vitamin K epoxide reductase family protein [Acidobacteriota bacterium]